MKKLHRERELIANFLQLPVSEDPSRTALPQNISDIVEKTWECWGFGTEITLEQRISENWQKIVGRKLSGKCAPEKLSESYSILIILSSSGPVKQELTFMKKQILQKIQKLEGCSEIKQIRIH